MNKYRQAALLIQRSKFFLETKKNLLIFFFLGFRGYLGRKQFNQLKLTSKNYQNQVNQFFANIEQINNQLVRTLTQLNDKLPGFNILLGDFSNHFSSGKTAPVVDPESDLRPRPPVRESSLNPSSTHLINNGTAGKYSLPTSKVSSSIPNNTLTTNELLVDYDSLLSYLTLKYGSPGERESCLRLIEKFF